MTSRASYRFASRFCMGVVLAVALSASSVRAQEDTDPAHRLLELTNQARAQAGLKPVVWDSNLAAAAQTHAELMARQAEISHRYPGEPDLAVRAASAGAKFSEIAENIAQGRTPGQIQGAWMQSQMHHDNLMNANIDRIGVGVVAARGTLFAVVDFSKGVESLSRDQVEATVGKILADKGLTLMPDASGARKYCELDDSVSGESLKLGARFLMRWQSADAAKLPPQLEQRISTGGFKQAAVGSCAPHGGAGVAGGPVFSGYRVAVLLY